MTLNCATQSSKTDECRRNAGHRCPKRCSALELCSASCNEIIRDILALDGGVDLVSYHRGPRVRNDSESNAEAAPRRAAFCVYRLLQGLLEQRVLLVDHGAHRVEAVLEHLVRIQNPAHLTGIVAMLGPQRDQFEIHHR